MKTFLFAVAGLGLGCGNQTKAVGEDSDTGGSIMECAGAPEVDHDEYRDTQNGNVAVPIEAVVTADPTEGCEHITLIGVWLHYKNDDEIDYRSLEMDSIGGNDYLTSIPAPDITSAAIQYYFQAVGPKKETIEPTGADEKPLKAYCFAVQVSR